jgi:hypothetical protein
MATASLAAVSDPWPSAQKTSHDGAAFDRRPANAAGANRSASAAPYTADIRTGASRGVARLRTKCAGCGVIESVRQIDIEESLTNRCLDSNADRTRLAGTLSERGQKELVSLADTVSDLAASESRVRRTTSYEIVVRFRDGTRHVFTESAPRGVRTDARAFAAPRVSG